jgi:capsular polysaccharide biosynthesis protein
MQQKWKPKMMNFILKIDSNSFFSLMNKHRWDFLCNNILKPYAKFFDPYLSYEELSNMDKTQYWEFSGPTINNLQKPTYHVGYPDEIKNKLGTYSFDSPYVIEAEDVLLNSYTGSLIKNNKYVLFDYHSQNRDILDLIYSYHIRDNLESGKIPKLKPDYDIETVISKPAVPLTGSFISNYTHWTQEFLILLEAVDYYKSITGINPVIIIQEGYPDYVTQSLGHLGIKRENIKIVGDSNILLEKAVIPSKRRHYSSKIDGVFMRDTRPFKWLRQKATEKMTTNHKNEYSSRIFISREDADRRRVTNRNEMMNELNKLGFEKYILSELDYREQVRLFSQAEFIVGAHGSGLINGIYSNSVDTIEMYADRYTAAIYEIFQSIGHEYACLSCTPRGKDLEVDVDQLANLIKNMENENTNT